jgi:Spy/CpxP family protein refolding chaperone
MNKKIFVTILIVSVVINLVAFTAFGFFFSMRHKPHSFKSHVPPWMAESADWHKSHLKTVLGLSDEQVEILNAQQDTIREQAKPLVKELFSKRKELMELLKKETPDSAEAEALFQEIVVLQVELETMVFHRMARMKDLFTPEQREKLIELFEGQHHLHAPWGKPHVP